MKFKALFAALFTISATLACNTPQGAPPSGGPLPPPATEPAQIVTQAGPSAQPPTEAPLATATPTGLLPAPLYYVNTTDQQIWRIDVNGVTSSRITNENTPILSFDISPTDGSLAYVTNNNLVLSDSGGGISRILVTGGVLDPNAPEGQIVKEVNHPHWSPDGTKISYGSNGVNIIDVTSGQSQVVKQSDPYPDISAGRPTTLVAFYLEGIWSPDATQMLISYANFPEGSDYIIHSLVDGTDKTISFPAGGLTCCNPAWAPDSQSIYFSNDSVGLVVPGLWRVNAATGDTDTLISTPQDGTHFLLVSNARLLSDGNLYYFFSDAPLNANSGMVDWPATHTLTRSAVDGVTGRTGLRTDTVKLDEALWASDGRGAVVVAHTDNASVFGQGALLWMDTANGPVVDLHATGAMPHWGK